MCSWPTSIASSSLVVLKMLTGSFQNSVAQAVDSPSSPFSAIGIKSNDFSAEKLETSWNNTVHETLLVITQN